MNIIAFLNQKGGVGKTTSAVNIGSILANEHDRKVLLIDLDPQGNLSDHLGVYPGEGEKNVYDLLADGVAPTAICKTAHGMTILPASIDLSAAESELVSMMSRETRLKKGLGDWCENFDYVILDCPPSLGLLTICGLTLAHSVIVPMEAEYLALKGLSQLNNTLELIAENLNSELQLGGVLFCMYTGNTLLARRVKQEVEEFFPGKVFETCIRRNVRLAEAPSYGMPVNIYDPCCVGTNDYRLVTEEILSRYEGEAAKKKIIPSPDKNTAERASFDDPTPPEIRKTPVSFAPSLSSRPAETVPAVPATVTENENTVNAVPDYRPAEIIPTVTALPIDNEENAVPDDRPAETIPVVTATPVENTASAAPDDRPAENTPSFPPEHCWRHAAAPRKHTPNWPPIWKGDCE